LISRQRSQFLLLPVWREHALQRAQRHVGVLLPMPRA
jgi:hypothetical protein